MSKTTVAHFIDTFVLGGAETMLLEICKAIQERGYSPLVLHFGNPHFNKLCPQMGFRSIIVPQHGLYKSTKTLPLFGLHFKSFLHEQKIDILHSHIFGPITGGAFGACLARVPHIGTLHDVYMIEEKRARFHLIQAAALLGTKLVAVSDHMKSYYNAAGWLPKTALQTIHNGVQIPHVSPQLRIDIRTSLGIDKREVVGIIVGRLVELKGHSVLLQAVNQLNKDLPFKLLIVGDGEERQKLEDQAQHLGLAPYVKFLGTRYDVAELLSSSDIFILPSFSEGLSRSILEAMAAGLPCIVTNVGGNTELVTDQQSGLVIPPNDVESLTKCISKLILDPVRRSAMGQTGGALVLSKFSIDSMANQYCALYENCLTRKR